jgi:hypothetical protein
MCKKLVIATKILGWSGVSNTPKILWYLANHGIQNRFFLHASQTPPWKKYHSILQYHDFVSKL